MSMVSHCVGTRFIQLVGGVMTSFYDWYADLPVASPQVFGDQTDVPESGDWWDATYLMMWGSNVPVTRTPDAHWMAEVRYRGTKVVTVSPDYADNTKFADEWMPAQAGTDAALAMAMGHVLLKEFFVERDVSFFTDYVRTYSDLPFLVRLEPAEGAYAAGSSGGETAPWVPGKFLTAADLAATGIAVPEEDAWKTVLLDEATGQPAVPNGSMGFRYADSGKGRWNLDLEGVTPALTMDGLVAENVEVLLPAFVEPDGTGSVLRRGVPARRVGGHLVTTVFDLMLAQYGVGRDGLLGEWPTGYDDVSSPYTPAWQAEITGVPGRPVHPDRPRVRDEQRRVARALDDHHGRRHLPVVPRRRDLPGDPLAPRPHRLHGPQRRRLGALRRTGEVPAHHRLDLAGQRPRLGPAAAHHDGNVVLVHAHRPVAQRRLLRRLAQLPLARGHLTGKHTADTIAQSARMGWMPFYPQFSTNPLQVAEDAQAAVDAGTSASPAAYVANALHDGTLTASIEDVDAPENWPRTLVLWRSNLMGSSAKGNEYFLRNLLGTHHNVLGSENPVAPRPSEVKWHEQAPEGKLDLLLSADFRMTSTTLLSDVVLPAATWYEKHDLSSTDMHPFVHAFTPAIDPPWEAKSDFELFHLLAEKLSDLARTHLGVVKDLVSVPLMHDTLGETAQPGGRGVDWRATGQPGTPGRTMPVFQLVERDYTAIAEKLASVGPARRQPGLHGQERHV